MNIEFSFTCKQLLVNHKLTQLRTVGSHTNIPTVNIYKYGMRHKK